MKNSALLCEEHGKEVWEKIKPNLEAGLMWFSMMPPKTDNKEETVSPEIDKETVSYSWYS